MNIKFKEILIVILIVINLLKVFSQTAPRRNRRQRNEKHRTYSYRLLFIRIKRKVLQDNLVYCLSISILTIKKEKEGQSLEFLVLYL